ncbi:MAG TPA: MBL fold metallo-hydrolase [Candidatus Norongarragalinales archaeon]|jgi:glyoxylase-like metal-dependent hydrolase (beta-lactamase superfamily II)|nr:MBL fold metallo-hydrolase [Candidatus Norongarragalinales archaeon]
MMHFKDFDLQVFIGGPFETNGYLLADKESSSAIVIDSPQETAEEMMSVAQNNGLRIKKVIITHAHPDHFADASILQQAGASVVVGELDAEALRHPWELAELQVAPLFPDELVNGKSFLQLGRAKFKILHRPGHTPGSICLFEESAKMLFSGDVLFHQGMGRTDFAGGDYDAMMNSLTMLSKLPPETMVLPGHGIETTIEEELSWLEQL